MKELENKFRPLLNSLSLYQEFEWFDPMNLNRFSDMYWSNHTGFGIFEDAALNKLIYENERT